MSYRRQWSNSELTLIFQKARPCLEGSCRSLEEPLTVSTGCPMSSAKQYSCHGLSDYLELRGIFSLKMLSILTIFFVNIVFLVDFPSILKVFIRENRAQIFK